MYPRELIEQFKDWDLCDRFLCFLWDFQDELYLHAMEQSDPFRNAIDHMRRAAGHLKDQDRQEHTSYFDASLQLEDYLYHTIFLCALRNGLYPSNASLSPDQDANILVSQSPYYQSLLHRLSEWEEDLADLEGFADWREAKQQKYRQEIAVINEYGLHLGREMRERLCQQDLFAGFLTRTQRPTDEYVASLFDSAKAPTEKSIREE